MAVPKTAALPLGDTRLHWTSSAKTVLGMEQKSVKRFLSLFFDAPPNPMGFGNTNRLMFQIYSQKMTHEKKHHSHKPLLHVQSQGD